MLLSINIKIRLGQRYEIRGEYRRRSRPRHRRSEFKMSQNMDDSLPLVDKGDDTHFVSAMGAEKVVHFVYLFDESRRDFSEETGYRIQDTGVTPLVRLVKTGSS